MAFNESRVFRAFIADKLANTFQANLAAGGDQFKVVLYSDAITPDQNVAATAARYQGGVWTSVGNGSDAASAQRYEGTQAGSGDWWQGGMILQGQALDVGSAGIVYWRASNTVSGSAADLSGVQGCMVYDSTIQSPIADRGVCYNSFGGSNSVVNGTFTVIWSTDGIMRASLV